MFSFLKSLLPLICVIPLIVSAEENQSGAILNPADEKPVQPVVSGKDHPAAKPQSEERNAADRVLAPMTFRDTKKNKPEDYAGTWIAYRMFHRYPSAKLTTKFILTPDGKWFSQENEGEPVLLGSFHMADEYILFRPAAAAGKPVDEKKAIPASLLDKDRFILTSDSQMNEDVLYRKETSIQSVKDNELEGEWRFYEVDPKTQKKRQSPFTIEFKKDNTYEVHVKNRNFSVPDGAEKGIFSVEKDLVILKNTCTTPGPWQKMSFFLLFDNLIWNQPGGYIFGTKE